MPRVRISVLCHASLDARTEKSLLLYTALLLHLHCGSGVISQIVHFRIALLEFRQGQRVANVLSLVERRHIVARGAVTRPSNVAIRLSTMSWKSSKWKIREQRIGENR